MNEFISFKVITILRLKTALITYIETHWNNYQNSASFFRALIFVTLFKDFRLSLMSKIRSERSIFMTNNIRLCGMLLSVEFLDSEFSSLEKTNLLISGLGNLNTLQLDFNLDRIWLIFTSKEILIST